MTAYTIGIDVGTSGTKALLLDEKGAVRAAATHEYPLSSPKPLWSEQDPAHWWQAAIESIKAVLAESGVEPGSIAALGLTGQMHGLVLLASAGEVLRPAMLWNDQRTSAECAEIHRRLGKAEMIRLTGKPALPSFTAPKVLWVRRHEPDVFQAAAHLLLPKDYVRYCLTGVYAMDVADASGTSLVDIHQRHWSETIVEALEIPRAWLPEIHESPDICAAVSAEAAALTGLREGTPVVAGAGDQAAEAVGCGIVGEGPLSVTIGTSGVVFAASPNVKIDPEGKLHAYCHASPDTWHLMGVMLSAGGSLQWYRNELCGEEVTEAQRRGLDPYELLSGQAATVAPGCEGLIYLPYLTGERTPHPDPFARGAFVGLTRRHGKAHLTRAVLEGVTFGLLDCLNLLRAMEINPPSVRVSGGGARSPFWRQMLADVFETDVATVNATQGAAYGAGLLAAVGAGIFPDVPTAARVVREVEVTTPSTETAPAYRAAYGEYRALYPLLKPRFEALGAGE